MLKKTIPIAAAVILTLSAGAAAADQTFETVNYEPFVIMHYVPGTKTRPQVDAERMEAPGNSVTANGWRYVGGETGWELVQHDYKFRDGMLAHTDKCDHRVTPKPSLASIEQERKLHQNQYLGG